MKSDGTPYYYQMINTYNNENPKPMSQRGYIDVAKNIAINGDVASATTFRNAIKNAPNKETAKKIFTKHFKEYNESTFELIYNKLKGVNTMSENLNILRQLAGLGVKEDAPVEFDTPLKPEKIKFAPVSKSSAVMSIANRFPAGAKVNDPEVKQEEFLKALMKSPESLLSEINERIMPDDNGLEVSKKLSEIIDSLDAGGIMKLDDADRSFVLKIVKVALKKMKLEAGDDRDFDPESGALENVDLSDIRSEYGVEEAKLNDQGHLVNNDGTPLSKSDWYSEWKREQLNPEELSSDQIDLKYRQYLKMVKGAPVTEGGSAADIMVTDCESWIEQCDNAEDCVKGIEDLKYNDPSDADEKYANSIADSYIDKVNDKGLEDVQSEILNNAFNDEPEMESFDPHAEQSQEEMDKHAKKESAPFGEPSQQDMMADELNDAYEKGGEEELAKAMGLSIEELDQEMTEFAMDHNLHMDDDRDEVIHGYIAQVVDNADYKDHGEQDFDPADAEMESKDEAVEDTTAKALEAAMSELRTLAGLNS
jgi:hypothetical protein